MKNKLITISVAFIGLCFVFLFVALATGSLDKEKFPKINKNEQMDNALMYVR